MTLRLGIDFGTSNTVAYCGWPDGRTTPLLFDGSPVLPSAVCATPTGDLSVGQDAVANGAVWPQGYEPFPKRLVMDQTLFLNGHEVPVVDLIAAVLRRVATEATAVAGQLPDEVVCTYPASWGGARRAVLAAAAAAAGLGQVVLVDEPSAAATVFAAGSTVPVGSCLVVYDLGGGTFDASVVRQTATGFEVVATEGLADAGGLDIDAQLVKHIGELCATRDATAWERLMSSAEPDDLRARLRLWADVRTAKHMLSRGTQACVHVPMVGTDVVLVREELDQLATPILERTVTATEMLLRDAGLNAVDSAGVFLVGGASRMPLVASLLHRRLGLPPTVGEQPDLVVAQGALHAAGALRAAPVSGAPASGAPVSGAPVSATPTSGAPASGLPMPSVPAPSPAMPNVPPSADETTVHSDLPAQTSKRKRRLALIAAAVVLAVAGIAAALALDDRSPSTSPVVEGNSPPGFGMAGATTSPDLLVTPSASVAASASASSAHAGTPAQRSTSTAAKPVKPTPTKTTATAPPAPSCISSGVTYTHPNVPSTVCLKVGATLDVIDSPSPVYNASSIASVLSCSMLSDGPDVLSCRAVGVGALTMYTDDSWSITVTVEAA